MSHDPHTPSVRVEVGSGEGEVTSAEAGPSPTIEDQEGLSRRLPLFVGVISLALVVGLVLSARPDRGAISDGLESDLVASTTTDPSPVESTTSTSVVDETSGFVSLASGVREVNSIARADIGFLALSWGQGLDGTPRLFRSVNGLTWTSVETSVGDTITGWGPRADRTYTNLVRTEDGFALAMTSVIMPEDSSGLVRVEPQSRIARLVSPNGAQWELDLDFPIVETSAGYPQVTSHNSDGFSYTSFQDRRVANTVLDELFQDHVVSAEALVGGCWVEATSIAEARIHFCNSDPPGVLTAQDLVEPERFQSLIRCAGFLTERGAATSTVGVVRRGSSSATVVPEISSPMFSPEMANDGTYAVFDAGSPPWLDPTSCETFLAVPDSVPPALLRLDGDGANGFVRLPSPPDLGIEQLFSLQTQPVIRDRSLLVLLNRTLWSVDIDTGGWEIEFELTSPARSESSFAFSKDRTTLVELDESALTVTNVATGEYESAHDFDNGSAGYLWLIYVDDDVAFAHKENAIVMVDLTVVGASN